VNGCPRAGPFEFGREGWMILGKKKIF